MKKILACLLLVAAYFAITLNAAEPTAFTTTAAYGESYLWADLTVTKDTLVSVDSMTVVSTRVFPQGWNYVLVTDGKFTGTGSDSVALKVRVDLYAKDTSTVVTYSYAVDTLAAAATAEAVSLNIGNNLFGYKARVRLIGIAATGTQVITPTKWYIYAVRPVTVERKF